jgi:hypothetical protein
MSTPIQIGMRVQVDRLQPHRIPCPKYPGRIGTVISQNMFGNQFGGLWNVKLEPTKRAKGREETFWGKDLTPVDEAAAPVSSIGD